MRDVDARYGYNMVRVLPGFSKQENWVSKTRFLEVRDGSLGDPLQATTLLPVDRRTGGLSALPRERPSAGY